MAASKPGGKGPLRHLGPELAKLSERHLLRTRPVPRDAAEPGRLNLCSNDYLGYAASGRLRSFAEAALAEVWTGAGASRLVAGEHRAHRELERALAEWVGADEALVFTSGYAANVGTISALAGEGDLIVSDALNHASIIDGCRLSKAKTVVVPHLDAEAVRDVLRGSTAARRWVIVESYFSMDGDRPDLSALRAICDEYDAALVVDESHAMGVFGPAGRGVAAEAGVKPDVLVGTLGKALGAQGAFVTGSRELCAWLWNRARSFVFSTGMSPIVAAMARGAVELAQGDDEARELLARRSADLRAMLGEAGLSVASSSLGPIIPVRVGEEARALALSRALAGLGVDVQAIRPPTVPPGTARLRVTASSLLTGSDVERAGEAFRKAVSDVGAA